MKIPLNFRSIAIVSATATLVGMSACNRLSLPNTATQDTNSTIETTDPGNTKTSEAAATPEQVSELVNQIAESTQKF